MTRTQRPIRRRAALAAGALISLCALGPAPPESYVRGAVDHYMRQIEDPMAHGRLDAAWFDAEAIRTELAGRVRSGEDQRAVADWLFHEMTSAFLAFAPRDARYDPKARYRFPYDESAPRLVSSGVGDSGSHSGRNRYSYDFVMPVGTEVLSAREGVVARVLDGYTDGGRDDRFRNRANAVLLLHEDGSFAEYGHLEPGVPVEVGQRLAAGDVLGRSGNSGYSSGPHLHFAVRLRDSDVDSRTVPIRFSDASGRLVRPEPGRRLP